MCLICTRTYVWSGAESNPHQSSQCGPQTSKIMLVMLIKDLFRMSPLVLGNGSGSPWGGSSLVVQG
eukprot:8190633-Prorocentrum_lima.AAC.1